jgi:hypothetical protein
VWSELYRFVGCLYTPLTTDKGIVAFPGHSLLREPARRLRYKLAGKGDIDLYNQDNVDGSAREAGLRDKEIIRIPSGRFRVGRRVRNRCMIR